MFLQLSEQTFLQLQPVLLHLLFNSRSILLSARICRLISQRSAIMPFFFHILGNVAFMDGWLFGDSLICKAAVINGSIYLITCKHFIYGICPVCPPDAKLFITVPLFGNRILSAISAALGVFINPFISFFLCNRGSQIFFLFPNFIAILLFPSLFLSSFKFRSSKSLFLARLLYRDILFSVLYCHVPFSFSGRTVRRM